MHAYMRNRLCRAFEGNSLSAGNPVIYGDEAKGYPVLSQEAMPSDAFDPYDRRQDNLEKP